MNSKKQLSAKWESYVKNLQQETPIPVETAKEKIARIKRLEKDPEKWFKYHFPNYAYAEPAPFHKKATKRLIKNKRWYEVRAWSRELAKSTRAMFEALYLTLVKLEIKNALYVSHSEDNAVDLLTPLRLNLEFNQRLIHDYGQQKSITKWGAKQFTTKAGVSFRAIGGGQSPRGTKNEHARPDFILIDDFDTDEICRNPKRVRDRWNWIEQALFFTLSISQNFRFLFLGNIIAKVCTITYAIKKADYSEVINIRDKQGKSTWPEKNSEEDIDYMISKVSKASAQKELFNNPYIEGIVFKNMKWGKVPRFSKLMFLVRYGDPAPSDKETKTGCNKAVVEVAEKDGKFYIIRVRIGNPKNKKYIEWFHDLNERTEGKCITYNYSECNSLQNPHHNQVYIPLMKLVNEEKGNNIHIKKDDRKKGDKFTRIEGVLEPIHDKGDLILNEAEKDDPNMLALEEEFLAVEPGLPTDVGGVDAVEGAVTIIKNKNKRLTSPKAGSHQRSKSKHL